MITPAALDERLNWRYATKQFDSSRPIPDEHWTALENSLVLSPSSFGLQPWKFVVVDDGELRQKLQEASWNQSQITESARLVVFLGKQSVTEEDIDRLLQRTNEVRGTPLDALAGYRKMLIGFVNQGWASKDLAGWNARQVYLALGQFMTSAAMLGIDTCPMEGIDAAAYDRLLGIEGNDFSTLVACTAGYRLDSDKHGQAAKVRYDGTEVIMRR